MALLLLMAPGCARTPALGEDEPLVLAPGDHTGSLSHDDRVRSWILRAPPAVTTGRPLPLVLALHGGGGNADQFKGEAGLDEVADREGFLALYPHGTGPLDDRLLTWNAGTCCGYAAEEGVDDVGFLVALVDRVAGWTPVDRTRVYVTGHSNGGMMSHRLAIEAPGLVAAAVPVAGGLVLDPPNTPQGTPLLHIHSVDDPRALYEGGLGPPFPLTNSRVFHPSVEETLAHWREANGCTGEPTVAAERAGRRLTRTRDHTAELLVWECVAGTPLQHWRLHGVGHGWPGELIPRLRENVVGPSTDILDASEEAWAFMQQFRLRGEGGPG